MLEIVYMTKSSTRLVLICGLPASGKSTLARQLAPEIPAIRLDKDGWATQLGADLWDEHFECVSNNSCGFFPRIFSRKARA